MDSSDNPVLVTGYRDRRGVGMRIVDISFPPGTLRCARVVSARTPYRTHWRAKCRWSLPGISPRLRCCRRKYFGISVVSELFGGDGPHAAVARERPELEVWVNSSQ